MKTLLVLVAQLAAIAYMVARYRLGWVIVGLCGVHR